ncbi:MAG: hypothetical protein K8H88_32330 [Sandaracinaceae bacterium]|nr:hypothetical protein [Sandaracinaceae bacterium]
MLGALSASCATGSTPTDGGLRRDAGLDANIGFDGSVFVDAGVNDSSTADANLDSGVPDGGRDGGASGCGIAVGDTPAIDGSGDIAAYPTSQVLTPGVTLSSTDVAAITWSSSHLYVTMTSDAFTDASRPLHVYLELGTTLGAVEPGTGKEYGGNLPTLPFRPTHLIAIRRTSDLGPPGPYDGVYVAIDGWTTPSSALVEATDVFASADQRTLSVRIAWSAVGSCPLRMRLAAHVVYGAPLSGMEWKDAIPSTHTPWTPSGGAFYEIDLTADPTVSSWTVR